MPNAPLGLELYVDYSAMRRASLTALRLYADSLEGETIDQVAKRMKACFLNNLATTGLVGRILDALCRGAQHRGILMLDITRSDDREVFGQILEGEFSRPPRTSLYLRPLWGWPSPEPTIEDRLVWVPGTYDLNALARRLGDSRPRYQSAAFPPLTAWDGKQTSLADGDSWIGARARSRTEGDAALQRIRGALSLTIPAPGSRLFSGATVPTGQFDMHPDGRWTLTHPESFVPPLLQLPAITAEMVAMMRRVLVDHAADQRLQVALEYAAAGWEPRGRLGFLHNAIALDALFGDQKVGIRKTIRAGIEQRASLIPEAGRRADLLWDIRNALMHGKAASIEACPQYLEYFEAFDIDPADDQLRILRACVWDLGGGTE